MPVYSEIRIALETGLASVTGLPSPVQWDNVQAKPQVGSPWTRATLMHESRRPETLGPSATVRYDGLLAVDLFYPTSVGPGAADDLADAICAAFEQGQSFTESGVVVQVLHSEAKPGMSIDKWYMVPVEIFWYCYN